MGVTTSNEPTSAPKKYAWLKDFTHGITPPSDAEHAEHQARLRDRMREAGLAALVIEPGATMLYLTGARWGLSERPFLLLFLAEGPHVWIAPAFERLRAEEVVGAGGQLALWREHESPYALAASTLRARGVTGRVGVERELRWFVSEGLSRALDGAVLESGEEPIRRCRIVKTPEEIARLNRANQATKAAIKNAAADLVVGMDESELADMVTAAQQTAGLSDVWVLALFGPNAAHPHGTGVRRRLARGDVVLVDTGGALHGYQSDVTRTWVAGTPTERQRRIWDVVKRAQSEAMDAIRPGVRCSEIDAIARLVITEAGFGEQFTHRLGHGIGLEGHEEPYLARGNDTVLEAGMTMSVEPGIYLPGELGVRIEDIVAVRDDHALLMGPPSPTIEEPFGAPGTER